MRPGVNALSDSTAARLRLLLGEQDGEEGDRRPQARGVRPSLVRCTSATAIGTAVNAAGEFCYPAVEVRGYARDTTQTDGGECYLTVWDDAGAAGVPVVDRTYLAVMSGEIELVSGDPARQRAFAVLNPPAACERFTTGPALIGDGAWHKVGASGGGSWDGGAGAGIYLPAAGHYLVSWDGTASGRLSGGTSVSSRALVEIEVVDADTDYVYGNHAPTNMFRVPDGAGGWFGPVFTGVFGGSRLVAVTEPTVLTIRHKVTVTSATLDAVSVIVARLGYLAVSAPPADGGIPP